MRNLILSKEKTTVISWSSLESYETSCMRYLINLSDYIGSLKEPICFISEGSLALGPLVEIAR
jgi:hypothetical protein